MIPSVAKRKVLRAKSKHHRIALLLIGATVLCSCSRKAGTSKRTTNARTSQIRSLSFSGLDQASLIPENTRELKITTDNGRTWQSTSPGAVGGFECATLIDSKSGFAVNRLGQVFSTDSGGVSWNHVSQIGDFTGANQIEFLNKQDGWLREFLGVWRTRDGGMTWKPLISTVTPGVRGQPTGMFVINVDTAVVSASGGQVFITKDGGNTWKIESPLAGEFDFNDVWFDSPMHGWVVGSKSLRPLLLETRDGGDSWKEIPVDNDIFPSSTWFSGSEGWLAGGRRVVEGKSVKVIGILLHTNDGGKQWSIVQLSPDEPSFSRVRFIDKIHGWLVGLNTLYRTDDGGTNWYKTLILPPPG